MGERVATGSREVDATGVLEGGGMKEMVLLVNCPVAECLDGRLRDHLGMHEPTQVAKKRKCFESVEC